VDAVRAECEHWHRTKGGDDTYTRMANCSVKVRAGHLEPQGFQQGRVQWRTL